MANYILLSDVYLIKRKKSLFIPLPRSIVLLTVNVHRVVLVIVSRYDKPGNSSPFVVVKV